MSDICPYCGGRGLITQQSTHVYSRSDVTTTCDCLPRDPPSKPNADAIEDQIERLRKKYK